MIRQYMIMEVLNEAGDAVRELIPLRDHDVVHHSRVVTSHKSRIDKYRRQGVSIFDEIEVNPEMLKPRATFSINTYQIWAALQDIQLTTHHMVGVRVVCRDNPIL